MQLISQKRKLPKKVIDFWVYYLFLIFTIIILLAIVCISLALILNWNKYILYSFVVILAINILTLPIELIHVKKIKYFLFSYSYTEKLVEIEYGWWFFKSYKSIPISKIYAINIYQGPILKKFNLYNISLVTMANTHDIEGLELQEAKKIQEKLKSIER